MADDTTKQAVNMALRTYRQAMSLKATATEIAHAIGAPANLPKWAFAEHFARAASLGADDVLGFDFSRASFERLKKKFGTR